ncbi:MAG: hypothetical protein MJ180_06620, partial [Candidatus Gastranaerophilales bacterium]|nr:hypothetical protein [Candidatus Gastranaerophilales bacterium]
MSIQELVKTYLVVSESIKQSESNKKTSGQNKTSSTPVFTNNTDIANLIPTNLKSSLTQTNGIVNSSNISIFNNTLNKTNAFDNIINSSAQISNATQTNQNDLAGALTDIMKNFSNMIASLFGSN